LEIALDPSTQFRAFEGYIRLIANRCLVVGGLHNQSTMAKRDIQTKMVTRILTAAWAPMLIACMPSTEVTSLSNSPSAKRSLNSSVQAQALTILTNKCAACHSSSGAGGVSNITDVNHLLSSGLITLGQPSNSRLIATVESNRMPPGAPLSTSEKEILRTWVVGTVTTTPDSGQQPGGGTNPTTPGVPVPLPTPQPPSTVTGSLDQKAVTILQNQCFSCHGTSANGGISRINDPAHLISIGAIVPGNATGSKIYDSVSKGRMPVGQLLNPADQMILRDWINAGAKAPGAGTVPPAPTPIPLKATYSSIQANILGPKCIACHGPSVAKAGVRYDSYTATLRTVRAGRAIDSDLYKETSDGGMPENAPRLSSAELKAIADWINAGAKND
jgi:mono/diheme cytochrome c family protein